MTFEHLRTCIHMKSSLMARIKLIIIIIVQVACLVIFVNFDFSEIVNRSCPSKKQRCSVHLANQMARDYSRKPENVTTTDAVDENNHSFFGQEKGWSSGWW